MIALALVAAAAIDAAALAQTTATLNALGPHAFGSPRNRAAAQFVGAKLQDAGLAETTVEDFEFEGAAGTNVVARIPGRSDRLLILATHHDTLKDATDVTGRSRTLATLIELGRQAARLRPSRTWILASFDGGESRGEGFARYLESLGSSRSLIDGVLILDAAPAGAAGSDPVVMAPACPGPGGGAGRSIAGADLIRAALAGLPEEPPVSFDDPGISLMTQPFLRAFRTRCDPLAARALAVGAEALTIGEIPFSRTALASPAAPASNEAAKRDEAGARLGNAAFQAFFGIDSAALPPARADSWLVVGRTVLSGWLIFLTGLAALLPGLFAARGDMKRLAIRLAYSALFGVFLFQEPEVGLFTGLLPSLVPAAWSRRALLVSFLPTALLVTAGALSWARGQVTGSWLSPWLWGCLTAALLTLFVTPGGKKGPARARRGKK